jgi:hypothetical protein
MITTGIATPVILIAHLSICSAHRIHDSQKFVIIFHQDRACMTNQIVLARQILNRQPPIRICLPANTPGGLLWAIAFGLEFWIHGVDTPRVEITDWTTTF